MLSTCMVWLAGNGRMGLQMYNEIMLGLLKILTGTWWARM